MVLEVKDRIGWREFFQGREALELVGFLGGAAVQRPPDETQGVCGGQQKAEAVGRKERGTVGKSGEAVSDVLEGRGRGRGLEARRELSTFV